MGVLCRAHIRNEKQKKKKINKVIPVSGKSMRVFYTVNHIMYRRVEDVHDVIMSLLYSNAKSLWSKTIENVDNDNDDDDNDDVRKTTTVMTMKHQRAKEILNEKLGLELKLGLRIISH